MCKCDDQALESAIFFFEGKNLLSITCEERINFVRTALFLKWMHLIFLKKSIRLIRL
jgi:hypothetical protein